MNNFSTKIMFLVCVIFMIFFIGVSYAEESEEFVPVTYLDTEAKFDIPDIWIYEGVLYNKDYSQKKYTNIKNLDVSILYGMRNLKEEIKKKMPFIPADSILDSLSEESLVNILGSASNSTIEEKTYGNNKFYEFLKTQKGDNGETINCIVDMMVEGDNIYSFSYVYKNEKDGINDYGKVLTSFRIASAQNNEVVESKINETPNEPEVIEEKVEPIVEEIKEEPEPKTEQINEEVKEEIEDEIIIEPKDEEIKENTNISVVESDLSENNEVINNTEEIINEEIIEMPTESLEEEKELSFEEMGVVQNTYEAKSWIESIGLIIINNPVIIIGIVLLIFIEISFWRFIRKRRKNKSK